MLPPRPPRSQQTEPVISHLSDVDQLRFWAKKPSQAEPEPEATEKPPNLFDLSPGFGVVETQLEAPPPPPSIPDTPPPPSHSRRPIVTIADIPPLSGEEYQRLNHPVPTWRPWKIIGFSGLIALVLLSFVLWNGLQNHRANSSATAAQSAMDAGDWAQAGQHLARAQRLRPEQHQLLRAITRWDWATGAHPERIIQNLQKIASTRKATDNDFIQLARAELLLRRPTAAMVWLERISSEKRQTLEVLELETRILGESGQAKTAEYQFRSQLEARQNDPQARFKLAVLDYSNRDGLLHKRGRAQLLTASAELGDIALTALQLLSNDPTLNRQECERLLRDAEKHERATESRYRILSRLLRQLPEDEVNSLLEVETRRASTQSQDGRLAYASALSSGLPPLTALAITQEVLTQKNHPLTLEMIHLALEIHARLGHWQQARELLSGPGLALDRIALSLWEACIAAEIEKGNPEAVRKPLQIAIAASSSDSDPGALIRCADTALRLQQFDFASDLYEKAAQNPRLLPHLQLQYLEKALVTLRQHTPSLHVLLPLALRLSQHPAARETQHFEADYLHLLAGLPPEVVVNRLSVLPSIKDPVLRIRRHLLWAIIYHQRLQDAAFTREMSRITIDDIRNLPPGPRAVIAGLLHLNGDADHSSQIARTLPQNALLAEEKLWLSKVSL
jgi:hypothetical protein